MFYKKKKLNEYDNDARCLKKNKNRNVSRRYQDVFLKLCNFVIFYLISWKVRLLCENVW